MLQFSALKKQFVATRKVPQADNQDLGSRTFVAAGGEARAAAQNAVWFSLTQPASVHKPAVAENRSPETGRRDTRQIGLPFTSYPFAAWAKGNGAWLRSNASDTL